MPVGTTHQDHLRPLPFDNGAGDAVLSLIERYWDQLRKGRTLPTRTDIQPHAIDTALPHTFILQRVAPGVAKVRVAGQRLHDLLKMDPRGMPFSAFMTAEGRVGLRPLLEAAFEGPHLVEVALVAPRGLGRPEMIGRMLLLPLRDDDGMTTRVLGALVTNREPGLRHRRFDLAPRALLRKIPVDAALHSDPTDIRTTPLRRPVIADLSALPRMPRPADAPPRLPRAIVRSREMLSPVQSPAQSQPPSAAPIAAKPMLRLVVNNT